MDKGIWHYTVQAHLEKIIASGKINVTDKLIDKKEKPAVWLSSNELWEHTATKMGKDSKGNVRQLTKDECHELFVLARVQVSPFIELYHWKAFRRKGGISIATANELEKVGRERGANPDEWCCSFKPLDTRQWLAVELWDGEEWVEYP